MPLTTSDYANFENLFEHFYYECMKRIVISELMCGMNVLAFVCLYENGENT